MKYCKPHLHAYVGYNGVSTEALYVTLADIEQFHGVEFAQCWKKFAQLKENMFGTNSGFYYSDYKWHALTAQMWLHS